MVKKHPKQVKRRHIERYVRLLDTGQDNRHPRTVKIRIVGGGKYCDGRCVGLRRDFTCGCWLFQRRLRFVTIGFTHCTDSINVPSYDFIRCKECLEAERGAG